MEKSNIKHERRKTSPNDVEYKQLLYQSFTCTHVASSERPSSYAIENYDFFLLKNLQMNYIYFISRFFFSWNEKKIEKNQTINARFEPFYSFSLNSIHSIFYTSNYEQNEHFLHALLWINCVFF